jgi:tetratricopeptide (TPR) repeat protein
MLTWQQSEFLLKGIYLGLLVMIAWLMPSWVDLALIGAITLAIFLGSLGVVAYRKIREGYRVKDRWFSFLFLLVIENPVAVYSGLLVGLSVGASLAFSWWDPRSDADLLEAMAPVLGGAILGGVFYGLRHVRQPMHRFWIGLAMVAILVLGAAATYYFRPEILAHDRLRMFGLLLLLSIPGFYLLTFSGLVEESEIEIAAMCAALGLGLWTFLAPYSPAVSGSVVLLPMALFFIYTSRVMPFLRVLKHTLRGMSYRQMGQTQLALTSLGQALQYDPRNTLARQQMWVLHRDLDFAELRNQPEVVPYLNFNFCLERVSQILATKPKPDDLRETRKMLELIAREEPARQPVCAYWQAVADLHEHNFEDAASRLTSILQLPQTPTASRQAIHFAAWSLAMFGHPEMARRVGNVLLPLPGQRMDAIAAVESQLAATPDDPAAWDMKRQLYSDLTESEYCSPLPLGEGGTPSPPTPLPGGEGRIRFNHEYVQQLGLALLDNHQQYSRGCEYLRIAARGLPLQAATIFIQIAQTHEKHGDTDGMWANYKQAMQIGRSVGVQNLAAADKEALFATVKKIGDAALAQNELDAALEAYKFYSQNETAGIETWRMLAELFERKAAADELDHLQYIWQALHCTEHALSYNAEDKDLLGRKDRYYYSIPPEDLQARLENVRLWFDPQYCRDKARWVLEHFGGDFELLDWGSHLTELALVAQPGSHAARLLKARVRRLRGEIPETIAILEEIRQHRPEKFFNDEEAKAWYFAHRMLGDLYLDTQPADAVACYLEFRKSDEAGADTAFKLGKAYEALGDIARAAKCYQEVTVFERHPLYFEARDALDRLKRGAVG